MATQQRTRQWIIWRNDPKFTDPQTGYLSEQAFRAAVENELAAWENTGYRLGRGIEAVPLREQQVEGQYETVGWLFKEVWVPAMKTEQPPVEAATEVQFDETEQPVEEPQAA